MVKYQDLKNKRFGKLKVLELCEDKKAYNGTTKLWKCQCDCGNIIYKSTRELNEAKKIGRILNCGCAIKTDLIGKRVGDYTITKYLYSKNRTRYWECECICGDVIIKSTSYLGRSKCLCKRQIMENMKYRKNIRNILEKMKSRCYNSDDKSYKNYGGRGIKVCDEWLNCSNKFIDWAIKNGYKQGLSIDRIDNNGNYEPNNCRFVDDFVQANNKRNNLFIQYDNRTQTLKQWCRELGLPYRKTHKRLYMYGWSINKCFDEKERVGFI